MAPAGAEARSGRAVTRCASASPPGPLRTRMSIAAWRRSSGSRATFCPIRLPDDLPRAEAQVWGAQEIRLTRAAGGQGIDWPQLGDGHVVGFVAETVGVLQSL